MEAVITNVWQLKQELKKRGMETHFFDKETLRFFGERESDMRILKNQVFVKDWQGKQHRCYVLSALQRKAPGGACRHYYYFDVETFERIIPF